MIDPFRRAMEAVVRPIRNKVKSIVQRAVVDAVNDGHGMQRVQVKIVGDHVRRGEHFQPAGLTSVPTAGEGVAAALMGQSDHTVVLCLSNRAKRPKNMADGETAVYGEAGPIMLCDKDGNIVLGETYATKDAAKAVAIAEKVEAELKKITVLLATWLVAPNDGGLALQTGAKGLWGPSGTNVGSTASSNVKGKV